MKNTLLLFCLSCMLFIKMQGQSDELLNPFQQLEKTLFPFGVIDGTPSQCYVSFVKLDGITISSIRYGDLLQANTLLHSKKEAKQRFVPEKLSWLPYWYPSYLFGGLWRGLGYIKVKTKYPISYQSQIYASKKEKKYLSAKLQEKSVIMMSDSSSKMIQIANMHPLDSLIHCTVKIFNENDNTIIRFSIQNQLSDTLIFEGFSPILHLLDERHCDVGIIDIADHEVVHKSFAKNTILPYQTAHYDICFPQYYLKAKDKIQHYNLATEYVDAIYVWYNYFKYKVNGEAHYWKYFNEETKEYLKIDKKGDGI